MAVLGFKSVNDRITYPAKTISSYLRNNVGDECKILNWRDLFRVLYGDRDNELFPPAFHGGSLSRRERVE